MFLHKLKVLQYAVYWDFDMIDEVLAPVSILTTLNAVVDLLRVFRMSVIIPSMFAVTVSPWMSSIDDNDDSTWYKSSHAISPNGDIYSSALWSSPYTHSGSW